jgi:hypothetical protein
MRGGHLILVPEATADAILCDDDVFGSKGDIVQRPDWVCFTH